MRSNTHASPDDIDIVSLWGALRRSLPRLLAFTVGAGALTFGVLSLVAPRYASEAQLAIVSKSTNPFPDAGNKGTAPDSVTPRMDKEAMNTHARALVAPGLLLKVADELKLRNRAEFNSALGNLDFLGGMLRLVGMAGPRAGESEEDRVLGEVGRRLEVAVAKESRFIPIRFTSADPQLAADFANTLAEFYRNALVSDTIQETKQVASALDPKIEQLRKELIEAETEVERYRVQIDRTIGGQQKTPLIDQRLAELTGELSKADALKSDADVRWRTARELVAAGSAEVLPEVQKSPLIQSLVQQRVRAERQLSELSASLLPGHPRMQQLNADLAGLKRQITSEVQKFVASVEKEAKVAALRVDAISKQLSDLKGRVISTSGDDARLRSIEANAKAKRAELERLQRQLEDNNTVVVTKTVPIEARVISAARPSSVPVFPKKGPFSLLAMAATFMLGLAWTVTRELLAGARPSPAGGGSGGGSNRRAVASRTTAVEPALVSAAPSGATAAATTGASMSMPATEPEFASAGPANRVQDAYEPVLRGGSLEALADRLLDRGGSQGGYRTMITGDLNSTQVGVEASEIARSLSGAGKQVVLIDWSLDGRGIADLVGAPGKPGVTDLLSGSASFEDVVARIPKSDVHFIACGEALADPAIALDADGLNLVLDALDEAYDHIVVAARHDAARQLFETIQGRFDAGVTVVEDRRRVDVIDNGADTFLGFEVTDIEVIRYTREPAVATAAAPVKAAVSKTTKAAAAPADVAAPPAGNSISAKRMQMARGGTAAAEARPVG